MVDGPGGGADDCARGEKVAVDVQSAREDFAGKVGRDGAGQGGGLRRCRHGGRRRNVRRRRIGQSLKRRR